MQKSIQLMYHVDNLLPTFCCSGSKDVLRLQAWFLLIPRTAATINDLAKGFQKGSKHNGGNCCGYTFINFSLIVKITSETLKSFFY